MRVRYKFTNVYIDGLDEIGHFDEPQSLLEIFLNNAFILLASLLIFIITIVMFIPLCISLICEYLYIVFNGDFDKKYIIRTINNYYNQQIPKNKYYYLKGYTHYNDSLETFIYKFIKDYKDIHYTIEVGIDKYICGTGRRRSAHDIYLICLNYYPDITIDDVLKILVNLRNNNKIKGSYCNTIHKYVYHMDSNYRDDNDNTEYGKGIKFKDLINAYKE